MAQRDPQVVVLGGGSWGTTVASLLARNTPTLLWARDDETVKAIAEEHRNPRYLGDLLVTESLQATNDLQEAAGVADVLVVGVPSYAVRATLEAISSTLRPWVPIVSLVKGLEQGTRLRMTEVVGDLLPDHPAGVLAGPNLAREVLAGYAAAATVAMPDLHTATVLQRLFHTGLFRVYSSTDVTGVELAGALKNVYAIAAGMGDGVGAGDNTRATVITRALRELTRLGIAMGGDPRTFSGLAGMGDLIATCTSSLSRNRTVGFELGKGRTLEEIIASMHQVAEGVKSSGVVLELGAQHGVDMPIAREVDAVVNRGRSVRDAYRGLLRIAPSHETEGDSW